MNLFNLLAEDGEGNGTATIIIMVVLIVGIIGLFIWQTISGKKKQKEAQEMVNTLKIGDRVKTIGGICGFVAQINDAENTFVLETGLEDNKSYVKFDKGAIYQTAPAQGNAVATPVVEAKVEEKVEEKIEEPFAETTTPEKPKKAPAKKKATPKVEEKVEEVVEEKEEESKE